MLSQARMGTQMFLAGSEGLMGHISAMALASGLALEDIQMEHRGSIARRMQCVHCKGITDGVTTDPFTCSHCGLTLFVRDHFSRRLGAFQGVCVDAETPGDIPATEEIRP
ncbi:dimethylamine monooxygenase subunit DmmA family protein [Roseicyclus elongatus]